MPPRLKKKKICFFSCFFPSTPGGAELQAFMLAKALNPNEFDFFFISLDRKKDELEIIDGIQVYHIKQNTKLKYLDKGYLANFIRIGKILKYEKPQIVYQRMGNSATGILQIYSKLFQFHFIWACANDITFTNKKMNALTSLLNFPEKVLMNRGIKNADTILVQTNIQKNLLKRKFDRRGILLKNCHPIPYLKNQKSTHLLKVIWVANFRNAKQPDKFIDLAHNFQQMSNVSFVMIGRPAPGVWQKELNIRLKQTKNITYLGGLSQERVNSEIEKSHIFVNTSLYEGFPNTFIQAWLRKIPVVSLNVDPDDLLSTGELGFHSGTPDKLYDDVKTLLTDPMLRQKMGEKARTYAIANHSHKKIARQFKKLLSSIT